MSLPDGLEPFRGDGESVIERVVELGVFTGELTVEKLLLVGLLRPQDLPLTPDLKLAEIGVPVFIAYILGMVLLIAAAGSRKPNAFVVIGADEIGAALLLLAGLSLFRSLRGDGLGK